MTARLALRVLMATIAWVACFPGSAAGSPLQGAILWEREDSSIAPVSPTEVRYNVHVQLALRWSFYLTQPTGVPVVGSQLPADTAALYWGPVSSLQVTHESVPMIVRSINMEQDWLIVTGTVAITVPLDSPALRLTVED